MDGEVEPTIYLIAAFKHATAPAQDMDLHGRLILTRKIVAETVRCSESIKSNPENMHAPHPPDYPSSSPQST
jgi:hypothetical protein